MVQVTNDASKGPTMKEIEIIGTILVNYNNWLTEDLLKTNENDLIDM